MFALVNACRTLSATIAALVIVAFAFGASLAAPSLADAMTMADGCHDHAAATPEAHDSHHADHGAPADNCLGDCLSACLATASIATIEHVDFVHIDRYARDTYYGATAPRPASRQPEFVTPPPRA